MNAWDKIGEEASIVLIGNFNPSIFHPEWFIRHEIVPEWDYQDRSEGDEGKGVATISDLAQIEFPDQKHLSVVVNKFVLRSARATEFLTIKDMVTRSFEILQETPVIQMGMNYQAVIRIEDDDLWHKFGEVMAPKEPWLKAAPFINDLDSEQQAVVGLLEMTMQLPRFDDLSGLIRPTIKATNIRKHELSIGVNNHVNIEDRKALTMLDYLNQSWDDAMSFASDFIYMNLESQLAGE